MYVHYTTLVMKVGNGALKKGVVGGSFCRVQLDRAFATVDWCTMFAWASVKHLTAAASDHAWTHIAYLEVGAEPKEAKEEEAIPV